MPAFEVAIVDSVGQRKYAGRYYTAANAVFGAMRFRENELFREISEGLPDFAARSEADHGIYSARQVAVHTRLACTTHITVSQTANRVAKKVHRVTC